MTKDRVNYRLSKKQAHGGDEVERSIGITCTRHARHGELRRPVALLKWAFDDYIVEEELPDDVFMSEALSSSSAPPSPDASSLPLEKAKSGSGDAPPSENAPGCSFVLQLLSEGVPDPAVEKVLRERLHRSVAFHFLTHVDYVSCASRYVWLRCDATQAHTIPRAFWGEQQWHTSSGDVFVSPLRKIKVPATATSFPVHLLPRTRYTVTLRNIQCSLSDVLPQLRGVAQHGFLNYSHVARHGVGLSRIFDDAKLLLQRDYPAFLRHHVERLSEGTTHVHREMPLLLEVLASPGSSRRDWEGVQSGIELAVKKDVQIYQAARQSGLYAPHHDLLLDFVRRASDIMPRHHDSAQLIREAVKPLVLEETLRAINDVHFNAMASIRWQQSGGSVAVGDLVRVAPDSAAAGAVGRGAMDHFAGSADHVNGFMTSAAHQSWTNADADATDRNATYAVKRVLSKAEAAAYTMHDVVLPTFGSGAEELLSALYHNGPASSPQADLYANLVRELRVEGLAEMQLAPRAALRPLVQCPHNMSFYLVDEKRGWDWVEDAGAAALKASLRRDQDGVTRYRSPLAQRTEKNVVARAGIRADVARNFFLKPARKPGMTCVMQMTLPAGSHATSAVREAVMVATLSPSSIFRLLAR